MMHGAALLAVLSSVVAVEASPELEPAAAEALTESCSSVFASDEERACALEGPGARVSARYRVTVDWKPADGGLQATIELERTGKRGRMMRVLSFHESSGDTERWEAVGLVVAALVSAEMVAVQAALVDPEPPPLPPTAPPRPQDSTYVTLEISGAIRQEGAPEFLTGGGLLRLSLDWGSVWQPTIAVGGLAGTSPVNQISLRPSLGLEAWLARGPVGVALRLEAMALVTRWSAEDVFGKDVEWHPRYGASLGPMVAIPLSSRLGLSAGVAATALFPPVEVRVRSESLATSSVFGVEGNLGLWARF